MASIEKRVGKDGRTTYRVDINLKGCPRIRATFDTLAEAKRYQTITERRLIEERNLGKHHDLASAMKLSLGDALARYREEVTPTKKSQSARSSEESVIRRIRRDALGEMRMPDVRRRDIAAFIKRLQADGLGANSVRLHLAVVSHCYNVAIADWSLDTLQNPVQGVRKPKLPRGRDRRLVDDEEDRLIAACERINPELADIVTVALETAAREGEILGLRWALIDLDKHTATLVDTKNGETRVAPLSERAEAALLRQRDRGLDVPAIRAARRRNKNPVEDADPRQPDVWTYTQAGMYASYKRALRQAGIEGLTFHDLRHEATSRLFERGLNPMVIQAITGHKTVQMLKRYTHLQTESLVAAVRGRL